MNPLEAEAIEILREAVAAAERPVLLYSIGKDSSVLLHLARKAFHPAPLPLPLLHVDTGWKFRAMYEHRDRIAALPGVRLIVGVNPDGVAAGVDPFRDGSRRHTDIMKTVALRQALDAHGFDVICAGARRDEEKSRSKERVFSLRAPGHRWDPRRQRPELCNVFNSHMAPGETLRVFPLSNWTELDIWLYIRAERIPVVPLYFAAARPVVERDGQLLVVDDPARFPFRPGETAVPRRVRFRTLGCWPLTAAVDSDATTLDAIIDEIAAARRSERVGRLIDDDEPEAMERRKREGYF